MEKRIVYITNLNTPQPKNMKDTDVWITSNFSELFNYIKIAMRMSPDQIIIDNESYKNEN